MPTGGKLFFFQFFFRFFQFFFPSETEERHHAQREGSPQCSRAIHVLVCFCVCVWCMYIVLLTHTHKTHTHTHTHTRTRTHTHTHSVTLVILLCRDLWKNSLSAHSSVLCRLTCAPRHASISPWRNAQKSCRFYVQAVCNSLSITHTLNTHTRTHEDRRNARKTGERALVDAVCSCSASNDKGTVD